MDSFGSYLKSQREAKNIRLEEIASITKIHLHNLHLLEKGEWSQLPPEPFIRGFIIAYAKYVGLETKETVRRYLESRELASHEVAEQVEEGVLSESQPADPSELLSKSGWSMRKIAGGVAAVVFMAMVAAVAYVGSQSNEPLALETLTEEAPSTEGSLATALSDVSTPKEPQTTAAAKNVKEAADPVKEAVEANVETIPALESAAVVRETAAKKEASGADKTHELVIEGKERTWMKIVIDEQKPRETFLNEGETMTLAAEEKIKVVLGNSTGTRVVHNGTEVTGEKYSGTIRLYIFPKNAKFPQDPPKRILSTDDGNLTVPAESGEGPSPSQSDL